MGRLRTLSSSFDKAFSQTIGPWGEWSRAYVAKVGVLAIAHSEGFAAPTVIGHDAGDGNPKTVVTSD